MGVRLRAVAVDTYAQVKQLVQTGVPEAQADAIINVLAGATALADVSKLATKDDLDKLSLELRGEMKGLKGELIWRIPGAVGATAVSPKIPEILGHLHA